MIAVIVDKSKLHCKSYFVGDGKPRFFSKADYDEVDEFFHCLHTDLTSDKAYSVEEYAEILSNKYDNEEVEIMTDEDLSLLMSE